MENESLPDIFKNAVAQSGPLEYAPGVMHDIVRETVCALGDSLKPGHTAEMAVVCRDKDNNLYGISLKVENPK